MLLLSDHSFDQLTCPLILLIPYTCAHAYVKTTAPMYCETKSVIRLLFANLIQLSSCTTIRNAHHSSITRTPRRNNESPP